MKVEEKNKKNEVVISFVSDIGEVDEARLITEVVGPPEAHKGKLEKAAKKARILFKDFLTQLNSDLKTIDSDTYEVTIDGTLDAKIGSVGCELKATIKLTGSNKITTKTETTTFGQR